MELYFFKREEPNVKKSVIASVALLGMIGFSEVTWATNEIAQASKKLETVSKAHQKQGAQPENLEQGLNQKLLQQSHARVVKAIGSGHGLTSEKAKVHLETLQRADEHLEKSGLQKSHSVAKAHEELKKKLTDHANRA